MRYLVQIVPTRTELLWPTGQEVGLTGLGERASMLQIELEEILELDSDPAHLGSWRDDNDDPFEIPISIIYGQLFHHANEHRAQICTILGSRGFDPPSVSVWGYAFASEQVTMT